MSVVLDMVGPRPDENMGSSMECIPLTIGDAGAAAHVPSDTKARVTSSAKGAEWLAHSTWRAAFGTRAVGRERLARGGPYAAVVAPMFVVT